MMMRQAGHGNGAADGKRKAYQESISLNSDYNESMLLSICIKIMQKGNFTKEDADKDKEYMEMKFTCYTIAWIIMKNKIPWKFESEMCLFLDSKVLAS